MLVEAYAWIKGAPPGAPASAAEPASRRAGDGPRQLALVHPPGAADPEPPRTLEPLHRRG